MIGKRKQLFFGLVTLCVLLTLGVAQAQTFQTGDVFGGVANGNVNWFRADGTFVQTLNIGAGGFTTGMAFDGAGNLYVTGFSANVLAVFDTSGNLINPNIAAGLSTPESIVFDQMGNFYVGNLGNGIRKYDAAGNFLGTIITDRVDWFDLTADQSTFYFTQEGDRIRTASNMIGTMPGADFANGYGGNRAFALRIRTDGGVLLADGVNVKRFDSGGNLIDTYDVAGEDNWFSLNLDPDGTSFWAGDFGTDNAYKFDITTGTVLDSFNTTAMTGGSLYGLAIFAEETVGGPPPPPPTVPEPGTLISLTVALLSLLGISRKRLL